MYSIISFLIKKQLHKSFVRESDERYKIFVYLIVIVAGSITIGLFLASFYDSIFKSDPINAKNFILFVNAFFCINYLIYDFYPVYKINPFLFPNYYPINKWSKALISLFIYSINYYTLFVAITYLQFFIYSNYFGPIELIYSLVFIYSGFIINRAIKNTTEYHCKYKYPLLFAILLTIILWYFIIRSANPLIEYSTFPVLFFILFCCYTISESEKRIKVTKKSKLQIKTKSFYLNALLNKNIYTTFSYAFFFKCLWLFVEGISVMQEGGVSGVSPVTWQFASPLIIFVYTGINFFGYAGNVFFTNVIREVNFKRLSQFYFKSMGVLMFIDSVIFWIFIYSLNLIEWEYILFYYTSVITMCIISFWFAIYGPRFTNNFLLFDFSLLKNRGKDFNLWGVGSLILVSYLLDITKETELNLFISFCLIAISVASLYLYQPNFSSITQLAYQRTQNYDQ